MSLFNQMAELNRPKELLSEQLLLSIRKEAIEKRIDRYQGRVKDLQRELEAIRKRAGEIQKEIDEENQMFV